MGGGEEEREERKAGVTVEQVAKCVISVEGGWAVARLGWSLGLLAFLPLLPCFVRSCVCMCVCTHMYVITILDHATRFWLPTNCEIFTATGVSKKTSKNDFCSETLREGAVYTISCFLRLPLAASPHLTSPSSQSKLLLRSVNRPKITQKDRAISSGGGSVKMSEPHNPLPC